MKLRCPNNCDNGVGRFLVTAHVTEDWLVDSDGEFLDTIGHDQEVVHRPTQGDSFTCLVCDKEAIQE